MASITNLPEPVETTSPSADNATDAAAPASNTQTGPVPLSFPAILRNPGSANPYAHLLGEGDAYGSRSSAAKKNRREDRDGKRWVRRKENAKFVGNPHIVPATRRDIYPSTPTAHSTFPVPLPPYLPRNVSVPASVPPTLDPPSANAGRFSFSLKGARKTLRRSGARIQMLVKEVEEELEEWLQGGVMLFPDTDTGAGAIAHEAFALPGRDVGTLGIVKEVHRTPLQLVWDIEDDAFARYVVHMCARFHEVVSFSKEQSGHRLTYLLRPNVTRPDHRRPATMGIATPPTTDMDTDLSSHELESDFLRSDIESNADALSVIIESRSGSPAPVTTVSLEIVSSRPGSRSGSVIDGWSVIGGSDVDADNDSHDEADGESMLGSKLGSLSLDDSIVEEPNIGAGIDILTADIDRTPRTNLRAARQTNKLWDRSASSPSRSPARRTPGRRLARKNLMSAAAPNKPLPSTQRSFYDYLFA